MTAKIDLDKFVRSLMERYYEKIHIDPTSTKCWLDSVLEDQGLQYKDGEIVEITQESKDERIRNTFRGWIYTQPASFFDNGISKEEMLVWIEKQDKPKWTEEDKDNLNMAIYFMRSENTPYSPTDVEPVVEWLCGLKQRMEE